MASYIEPKQRGLFDMSERLEELHKMGDPLARLDSVIDWSVFEPMMGLIPKAEPKGPGGRPGFAPLLMFKVLVIGHLYNLSDAQLEFQITDRHSFKRFLGITDASVHDSQALDELLTKGDPTTYVHARGMEPLHRNEPEPWSGGYDKLGL